MGYNDPHLEAEMELESRRPSKTDTPPPRFRRRQAWFLASLVGAAILGWLVYVALR